MEIRVCNKRIGMKIFSKIVHIISIISTVAVVGIVLFIYIYFGYRSRNVLNLTFLLDTPKGAVLGEEGGIFPAIIGSIYFSVTAVLLSFLPAICSAIYLKFYAKNKFRKIVHTFIESMASVPSIVLGLFSYTLFVYKLGFGRSIFSAGVALGIMILPFLERRFEKAFDEVDINLINASNNLGIQKHYMILRLIYKESIREIVSAILLCFGFAMGALAPMIFTGAVAFSAVPTNIFEPSMALPMHLYLLIAQGETQLDRAYATAFVELILLFTFNLIAYALTYRKRKL